MAGDHDDTPGPSIPGPGDGPTHLWLLTGSRLAANGSFRFLYPFLPVVAADLAIPDASAGVLVAALAIGGIMSPVVRKWLVGDHERTRRLLVGAALLVAAGTLATALSPVAVVAVIALMVLGAGKPLLDTAAISYVSARTTFQRRARATSTMELTWAGSLIVIAPLAGALANVTSWRVPLVLIAVSLVVFAWVCRHRLAPDPPTTDPPTTAAAAAAGPGATTPPAPVAAGTSPTVGAATGDAASARGIRATLAALNPTARDLLLVVALTFAALEATFSVFGIWLDTVHDVPLEQLGGFAAIVATGELLGAGMVTAVADRIGKARTLVIGLVVCALGLSALALTSGLATGVVALAVGLVGSETAIVAAIAIGSEVQPTARSHYLAVMFAVTSLTRAIVGGVGPAVFALAGIVGNVALSVVAALAAGVLLRRAVGRNPRLAD